MQLPPSSQIKTEKGLKRQTMDRRRRDAGVQRTVGDKEAGWGVESDDTRFSVFLGRGKNGLEDKMRDNRRRAQTPGQHQGEGSFRVGFCCC